jgi:hypothetical protein
MIKHPLYDIAVAEVRGQASPDEKRQLSSNVFVWRDALQQVVDEVESQFDLKAEEFEDTIFALGNNGASAKDVDDAKTAYDIWKSRARTFKKHVSARLIAVKRMCQDTLEEFEDSDIDIEKSLAVVNAAIALVEADTSDDDNAFEDVWPSLVEAVASLNSSLE